MEKISNQTVVVGREATFQCVVNNLNKYQVSDLSRYTSLSYSFRVRELISGVEFEARTLNVCL